MDLTECNNCFDKIIDSEKQINYSDHIGIEATFRIVKGILFFIILKMLELYTYIF